MLNTLKVSAVAAIFALSACGETDLERGATGALFGATAAHVTGESVAGGALLGGTAGALSCTVVGNC